MDHTAAGIVTATSKTALSSSQIASRVDPALVDVVSTDSYQGATSMGTGIVLSANGEVLTNNHVVDGATSIKVTDIGNGKTYTRDRGRLRRQPRRGRAAAAGRVRPDHRQPGRLLHRAGRRQCDRPGQRRAARAEPRRSRPGRSPRLNQSITASDELSSVSEQLTGLIETNAPIQPGDSGGSLVNSYGQVIGMDTAAGSSDQTQSQSSTATQAYAIPINEAVSIAQQIEAGTTTSDVHIGATAFLGLEIGSSSSPPADPGSAAPAGPAGPAGSAGSAARTLRAASGPEQPGRQHHRRAGGRTAVRLPRRQRRPDRRRHGHRDRRPAVASAEDVAHALVKYHPGDSISVTWVDQSGQSQTANLTLASGPTA